MKKLALILAAVLLATSVIFTGCNNTATNEENNNVKAPAEGVAAYYASLEAVLEEYQAKEALDNEVLATVNGLPVSASNVRYTTIVLKAPDSGYSAEEANTEAEKFYKENAALFETAYEYGIELSEEDLTSIKANISGMELQYGDEYDTIFAESPFTKFFYYFQTSICQALYNNIYEKVLADSENEITKSSLEEVKNEIVRAKHILIQFPEGEGENGELTDSQKADTLAKANAVLEEVNAMADISEFDALIEKYNEDPGMQSNPDGYYFGRGEMVPEFEDSAYSLSEGETSGLVETTYGYHILLKLPLESEEAIYNSGAFTNTFNDKLYNSISAKTENMTVEYAENHDARVEEFLAEYAALTAEAAE